MVSLYIWLSIYTNIETLRIIWKFDLRSQGALGRIYPLNIEVPEKLNLRTWNKKKIFCKKINKFFGVGAFLGRSGDSILKFFYGQPEDQFNLWKC